MSVSLSKEEKAKLRAEAHYRAELAKELAPHRGRVSSFLSHPAVLTIAGGIIIAAAGAAFQTSAAIFQADYTRVRDLREQKYAALKEFTTSFDRDMTYLVNLKAESIDLAIPDANGKDRYKRTAKEREIHYMDMWDKYIGTRQHAAILLYIESLFCSDSVREIATRLDAAVVKLEELDPPIIDSEEDRNAKRVKVDAYQSAVDGSDRETEHLMRELAHAMGKEIQAEPNSIVSFLYREWTKASAKEK